jgi:RNA polymerase sigma factor (sigma-70 family)
MFMSAPDSPRDVAAGKELQQLLNAAIEELPPKQRIAILLYEVEQMSVREIADVLECSEGVVKFNLFEARKKLRVSLCRVEPALGQIASGAGRA